MSSAESIELLLERHARSQPEALAVTSHDGTWSYGELYENVQKLAGAMSAKGVRPGERVVLQLGNSSAFVMAALACMWLAAPFVPVSEDEARERLSAIVSDCLPSLVVTRADIRPALPTAAPVTLLSDLLASAAALPDRALPDRMVVPASSDVYLIYTSGTSGTPKGVRISDSAFMSAIRATAVGIGIDVNTRSLCVSPFHFDGAYGTLFPTLLVGGVLVIPPREKLMFLKGFFRAVLEEGITRAAFSPAYLAMLLRSPQLSSMAGSDLASVAIGGEELVAKDLLRLWEVLPGLQIFNYYGPTETTIEVTSYPIRPEALSGGSVPLGTPHQGVDFYLASPDGKLIFSPGVVGELYIGGDQLMSGYWDDARLSAEVLVNDVVPGTTLYRTGDLASFDEEGIYWFRGRRDDVLKRRGVRISLAEIGHWLLHVDGVEEAVCEAYDDEGSLGIVAFIQGNDVSGSVMQQVARFLPANMWPDRIHATDHFPVTDRGKVDRRALLDRFGYRPWNRNRDVWG